MFVIISRFERPEGEVRAASCLLFTYLYNLYDEGVPSVAAVIDDIVEGFEDPI